MTLQNTRVQAVITPRSSRLCSPEVLRGVAELATEHKLVIQSHLCEQVPEMKSTLKVFLGFNDCSSVWDSFGLLTPKVSCFVYACRLVNFYCL